MKISLNNVKKYYRDRLVLDIEKLEIEKGKITGIIGPNGSGKSTLLNIISGLDTDYQGTICYDLGVINKDIYNKMTLVSQKPYLFKRRVYDNIGYPLKVRNIQKEEIKKNVDKIIDRLEIKDLREKKAHLLSGGESQKVSLARALVFEPELLLLDEPTSNIDPESIKILEREIVRFNKETEATVIIVTHNLEQSDRICDKIIYLQNGKVGL
ncbi:tungstate transport system ATP-binding protein [Proteiniborus ethanoligenes]|uniref:Tungstate transport system ATP-binding protein n=1 Tax=Proteiniborus ethanoligenes TaxID=415015 RepID=A0A1H3NJ74_9FIRM|nr:ATP-binding cassette domain-containing protein [Proteiniborus ethanoligenes]SDY88858.1 tungstate transport system ATP-binding protein [Proteiniborus ethanoligenes]